MLEPRPNDALYGFRVDALAIEPTAYLISGVFAVGMAVAFLTADPHSVTSRPLAALFGIMGVAFLLNIPAYASAPGEPTLTWVRVFSILEAAIMVTAFEWILRVGRTEISASPGAGRPHDALLRAAQGLACVYGLVGLAMPTLRSELWNEMTLASLRRPEYYALAVPFHLALVLVAIRLLQMLAAKLDPAEWLRLKALALAAPFLCAGLLLSQRWKPVSFALAEVIFLIGAIRYHVLQGRRGQFLSRFLSPQLVRLVRERGLPGTMQRTRVEISAVACDLRGFTAFAETASPEETMRLLEEYYTVAGDAVVRCDGSITNVAGDGILALVGAPVVHGDHARRALSLAFEIRERMEAVLSRWRKIGLDVGLGIGVASGFVTVGVIGSAERLEFTAIGPAVNLAARLCARAEPGQILADARVAGTTDVERDYRATSLETVEIKGFARPLTVYVVAAKAHEGHGKVP